MITTCVYDPLNYDNTSLHFGGWLQPIPDLRDYTEIKVASIVNKLNVPLELTTKDNPKFPTHIDLSKWCSPIHNQLALGSCCAQAAVSAVEYYQLKSFGEYIDGSRLFIYKVMRNLMGVTGDTGGYLRTVMAALVLFGVPPESYLPYDTTKFDEEPSAFIYNLADNYETTSYFCHDPQHLDTKKADVLVSIKKYLLAGIPSVFGTFLFQTYNQNKSGEIPFPKPNERLIGGHALLAVGYDDNKEIHNKVNDVITTTKGALKIQNSWGTSWGTNGYGWLPYKYVETGLAKDFWSLLNMEWFNTGHFGLTTFPY